MVFNQAQGAALEEYYALVEDPGAALNIVGKPGSDFCRRLSTKERTSALGTSS
jgi:hypothetical protein